jgi:two-component system nitrogen regulation sensor histidine kinase NtrY
MTRLARIFESLSMTRAYLAWAGIALVTLAIIAGLLTFTILTGLTPIIPDRNVIVWLLAINAATVLAMAAVIAVQVWRLIKDRRRGTAGAGLHIRLVSLFSIIAALPALIVAAFAAVTLNRGLDAWFSERTQAIVNSAVTVAEAYIRDNGELVRGDAAFIAADLNQQKPVYDTNRSEFVRRVARHAAIRGLVGAFVFDAANKTIDANVTLNNSISFLAPSDELIAKAASGDMVIIPPTAGNNIVRGLLRLTSYPSHYLYIYRPVNPAAIEQLAKTRAGKIEYDRLLEQRVGVQITFALMYAGVSFIFLLSAIWLGLWMADRIVAPVVRLLDASQRVSKGDLTAKVDVIEGPGDLTTLTHTFNDMTEQLKGQRDELVSANALLDDRRRFTEAMLAGVSAGVLGLDGQGVISLVNRSALGLLGAREEDLLGKPLDEAVPEFYALYKQALLRPLGTAEGHIDTKRTGSDRSFVVRVTTEASHEEEHGYVVTFDDITELVSAQRNSAWADIARRIAHEIKNPLTPIQLSAERLKRKYSGEIKTDKQVFEQCTDTIIRQVGDIGRMVDEFSSFARMPSAVLEPNDLIGVVKDATVLQRVSVSNIEINVKVPAEATWFSFDRRLVTQAVTNLVKNAREAVEARLGTEPEPPGKILVEAGIDHGRPYIAVTDNGIGLPKENRHRLTEPYMTTREKGTGLGLAIVKRIMEEHQGRLILSDAPQDFGNGFGAKIELVFAGPVLPAPAAADRSEPVHA